MHDQTIVGGAEVTAHLREQVVILPLRVVCEHLDQSLGATCKVVDRVRQVGLVVGVDAIPGDTRRIGISAALLMVSVDPLGILRRHPPRDGDRDRGFFLCEVGLIGKVLV